MTATKGAPAMTIPAPAAELGETAVCTNCGKIHWKGQPCPYCRQCSGCADLQRQLEEIREEIASLDRGLIEASGIAHDALTASQGNARAFSEWRECRAAIEAAGSGDGPAVPQPRRSGDHAAVLLRAAAIGMEVLPGGAA